ncbi:MAG: DUF1622 domain-containing protein [Hyphomicrobiaceae bacterium]
MSEVVTEMTHYIILTIDLMALVIIVFGTVEAFAAALKIVLKSSGLHESRAVWLRYGRWLVVGLTFQLAADIIETSITTDWESVVRLGAIALIRTMLNYYLERDLTEVRDRQREQDEKALV